MCGRFDLETTIKELQETLGKKIAIRLPIHARPFTKLPLLTKDGLITAEWVLRGRKRNWFNIRIETVAKRKSDFHFALAPATSFWVKSKDTRSNIECKVKGEKLFFIGFVAKLVEDNYYESALVTIPSSSEIVKLHSRMPLIVKKEKITPWLEGDTTYSYPALTFQLPKIFKRRALPFG